VARAAHSGAGVLLTTGDYAVEVMHFGLAVTRLAVKASIRTTSRSPMTSPAPGRAKRNGVASPVISVHYGLSSCAETDLMNTGLYR
jgi:D-erythrulose 4-kinase